MSNVFYFCSISPPEFKLDVKKSKYKKVSICMYIYSLNISIVENCSTPSKWDKDEA